MTVYDIAAKKSRSSHYSQDAWRAYEAIDARVQEIFRSVEAWEGWKLIQQPGTSNAAILSFVGEIYRSVCGYQPHTTEAAFHMIGRLPKGEVKLMQALSTHKAEEAEHGLWAREDLGKLGAVELAASSPAAFAVAAVWWRIATTEEPLGYLGAEYFYEQLTALATKAVLPLIEARDLPRNELRFVIEHATEDAKHAAFLKHHILDIASRYPTSVPAMLRCLDYFAAVWPLPVWREALDRALESAPTSRTKSA
jgi:hypothetical protein